MPTLVPELADQCVVVNGVAKTYAMTGWRVGWMIGPADVVKAATNLQSHATSNVSNVSQVAALAAVSGDLSAVADDARGVRPAPADHRRRCSTTIPGVTCPEPVGAFYAYPSVKGVLGRELRGQTPEVVGRAGRADPRRGRGGRRARARRSGRRATSGCPTRSATTTSSRASTRHADAARRGDRLSTDFPDVPRPTDRTSDAGTSARAAQGPPAPALHRARCGTRPCSTSPQRHGVRLPDALRDPEPRTARGHGRARLVPVPAAVRRRPGGASARGRRPPAAPRGRRGRGGRRVGLAGDPGRPQRLRRPLRRRSRAFLELVLDAAADAVAPRRASGIGVVVGANRTRHPLDARTLARLAAQYAGRGVVGFGLANDERRGRAEDFARAFRIAAGRRAASVPHGGELLGAASVRACLEHARRRPGRARGPVGRGPRRARRGRRPRRDPRGVPDVQRGARRLRRRRRTYRCAP